MGYTNDIIIGYLLFLCEIKWSFNVVYLMLFSFVFVGKKADDGGFVSVVDSVHTSWARTRRVFAQPLGFAPLSALSPSPPAS